MGYRTLAVVPTSQPYLAYKFDYEVMWIESHHHIRSYSRYPYLIEFELEPELSKAASKIYVHTHRVDTRMRSKYVQHNVFIASPLHVGTRNDATEQISSCPISRAARRDRFIP